MRCATENDGICCHTSVRTLQRPVCTSCNYVQQSSEVCPIAKGYQSLAQQPGRACESRTQSLQSCLDRPGKWLRRVLVGQADTDDGWSWQPGACSWPLNGSAFSNKWELSLSGRWIMFIGDSRGRFLFSSAIALVNRTRINDSSLPGWPSHRIPPEMRREGLDGPTFHSFVNRQMKGDCEDNMGSASVSSGRLPGCVLDYQAGGACACVRLTFVWHARSSTISWERTSRTLARLLRGSAKAPDAVVLAIGAWDMASQRSWGVLAAENVRAAFSLAMSHAAETFRHSQLRFVYGNWECNVTAHRFSWSVLSPAYRRGTVAMRDWYRSASISAGWLWLDVQRSQEMLPDLESSPCGAQHPYGALAEGHSRSLLGLISRTGLCSRRNNS
mmetsp:Transcript_75452/g.125799  ORF Transcript_75452/g.125799 Transcript_75452/m.125799 type:complete len:386 (-) Transcript_75452:140-1297(-)